MQMGRRRLRRDINFPSALLQAKWILRVEKQCRVDFKILFHIYLSCEVGISISYIQFPTSQFRAINITFSFRTPTTSCLFIVEILLIVGKQNSTSASRCRDQQLYFRTDIPLLLVDLRYDSINYQNNSLSWFNFPWLKVSLDHYDGYWIDFTDNRLDPSLINL